MSGQFIVIEGLEGAGKTSALNVVRNWLLQRGHDVVNTREPGGTPLAEALRDCVKQHWQERVTPEAELLLMYAARVQLVDNVIKPALANGQWVLGDRHDLSSRAYQGGGRQISEELFEPIRALSLKGFEPHLTLYLDVEPKVGLERARQRGELDRIEQQALPFFERTRQHYLDIAASDERIHVIDAMQPMEKVHQDILTVLEDALL